MWYVIQVPKGQEEWVRHCCEKIADKDILEEAFVLHYQRDKHYQGAWHTETRVLFPDYVFLVSQDVRGLAECLKRIPGLAKILGGEQEPVALRDEEVEIIKRLGGSERLIPMSRGIIRGDKVIITEGPVKGWEDRIRKIDRHRRVGWLDVGVLDVGRVEVGVEIYSRS